MTPMMIILAPAIISVAVAFGMRLGYIIARKEMKAALRFYANPKNYDYYEYETGVEHNGIKEKTIEPSSIEMDKGEIARRALCLE